MKKKKSTVNRRKVLKKGASILSVSICGEVLSTFIEGCESDTLKSTSKTEEYKVFSTFKTIDFDVSTTDEIIEFDVSNEQVLSNNGGSIKKKFGTYNDGNTVIIYRKDENNFVVLSSKCTHQGCEIGLVGNDSTMECPCHGSIFSAFEGSVVNGPAEFPLVRYYSSFDSATNKLFINFASGLPASGGAVKKTFPELNGGNPVLIIRHDEQRFSVLSSVCTHNGCEIDLPSNIGENLKCPCDGSVFSPVDGSVVEGPAITPLTQYPASFNQGKNTLTITYETESIPVGGSIKQTFGINNNGRPVIITRYNETEFYVLTSVCTHQGCEVNLPAEPKGDLVCPCHNSVFSSSNGGVKRGPAGAPLRKFSTTFDTKNNVLKIMF